MRYRLLALDLDGTLLDPYGALTPSARGAVAAARERGLEVVLCTGRRYRTALPLAEALSLEGEIVIHNGVLVKDLATGATTRSLYLAPDLNEEILSLVRDVSAPMLYVDEFAAGIDILVEDGAGTHPFQREYLADASSSCRRVESLDGVRRDDVIMISTMADERALVTLRERARAALSDRVVNHLLVNKNYQGMILEFLAPGAGKWPALAALAERRGISQREIVAIGDDTNDVEMIRNAGLGIAMGNAVRAARSAANLVVRSNAEGGVVEAIERAILKA